MDWSHPNTFKTSYECAHSPKMFRPQHRLYNELQKASSALRKPLTGFYLSPRKLRHSTESAVPLAYLSIYHSSYKDEKMFLDTGKKTSSGFSRNSKSQVGSPSRPMTAPLGAATQYKHSLPMNAKFKF